MDRLILEDLSNLNKDDFWGISPLCATVLHCQETCFDFLVDSMLTKQILIKNITCEGFPLTHLILATSIISLNKEFGLHALNVLYQKRQVFLLTQARDEYGRTPLRFACELGLEIDFIQILLRSVNTLLTDDGEKFIAIQAHDLIKNQNALHILAASQHYTSQEKYWILKEFIQIGFSKCINDLDYRGQTALHLLYINTCEDVIDFDLLLVSNGADVDIEDALGRKYKDVIRPTRKKGKTGVYFHRSCSQHLTCPSEDLNNPSNSVNEIPPENVLRLHVLLNDRNGTLRSRRIMERCKMIEEFSPIALENVLKVHNEDYLKNLKSKCENLIENEFISQLDDDTNYSLESFKACLHASGAVVKAIDDIFSSKTEISSAFCCIRPPGHHAGVKGEVDMCGSAGFCFLNHAVIGLQYALSHYGEKIRRVAILDFDVHHGNGTESLVKSLNSTNVFFASVHGYGKVGIEEQTFYPGSGKTSLTQDSNIINIGIRSNSRLEWRKAWKICILPKLLTFQADFIILSAGFDGHFKDKVNHGFCSLVEYDFEWLTESIASVSSPNVPILSILEGGYRIRGLPLSALAQSVAEYHVKVLSRPFILNWEQESCFEDVVENKFLLSEISVKGDEHFVNY